MTLNDDKILAAITLRSWARRSFPEVLSAGRLDPSSSFNFGCRKRWDQEYGTEMATKLIGKTKTFGNYKPMVSSNFFMGARSVRGCCRARVFLL